jgi:hypothetical protein
MKIAATTIASKFEQGYGMGILSSVFSGLSGSLEFTGCTGRCTGNAGKGGESREQQAK